jgi:alpha-amylase
MRRPRGPLALLPHLLSALIVLTLGLLSSTSARAEIIYQAFNERFASLQGKLDRIQSLGYSVIQISPPVKSIPDDVWWGRYQPIDLRKIEGPLGDEADLRGLIAAAHARGLKVIVDVVLNHMADSRYVGGGLQYPEFSARDFHEPDRRTCIGDFGDRWQVTHYWLCDENAHLPDLNTSSTYVRETHKRFLRRLLDLGADGFRIDAAKHIEPDYFADVLQVVPHGKFVYGEVIGETLDESRAYTGYMPVTDFHLLRVLLSAFSIGGDMRYLIHPEGVGAALPGSQAVVFARNHDTAMHSGFFNFGDRRDAMLAYAYVIGRGVGHALVYRDDYSDSTVKAAIRFRRALLGQPTFARAVEEICAPAPACDPRGLLVVERGDRGAMIINKSDVWAEVGEARMPGLAEGCYKELQNGFVVRISRGGDGQKWISAWGSAQQGGIHVGPRTALFLVRSACSRGATPPAPMPSTESGPSAS